MFADTRYWIAMTNPGDQWHAAAVAATRGLRKVRLATTEEVLVEYLNALAGTPVVRRTAADRVCALRENPHVEVIPQSADSFSGGCELYEARPDKSYSLTDCISMQAMKARRIGRVLTGDRHFLQEGFEVLLSGSP